MNAFGSKNVAERSSTKSAGKRLAQGTAAYMIGNMTSKIMQALFLPILTAALAPSDYGYYDLIITAISLVTPLVTLQVIEGMFRFFFDADDETKRKTASTVTAIVLASFVLLGAIVAIAAFVAPQLRCPFWVYLNFVSAIIFNYAQKLARCTGNSRRFAEAGVINTFAMLATQALTLLVFKMGVDGMLIANAVSYLLASLYLEKFVRVEKWLGRKYVDKKMLKELLTFSAPLIPNSVAWWGVSAINRYVVLFFLGAAANGIFAVAGYFSQLLSFAVSVFQLAWQESAIAEEKNEERDRFYSNAFNGYMKLLLGAFLIAVPLVRIAYPYLTTDAYREGYKYVPIMLAGVVLSAFSQFYGGAYLVFKKTSGALYTTLVAAAINLGIAVGLIQWIGLFAPALGTAVAFGVQWLIRARQLRDSFRVTIDQKALAGLSCCSAASMFVYYAGGAASNVVSAVVGAGVCVYFNRAFVRKALRKFGL